MTFFLDEIIISVAIEVNYHDCTCCPQPHEPMRLVANVSELLDNMKWSCGFEFGCHWHFDTQHNCLTIDGQGPQHTSKTSIKGCKRRMVCVGPDPALELPGMLAVIRVLNTKGFLECIIEVHIADMFVPRLHKSATTA